MNDIKFFLRSLLILLTILCSCTSNPARESNSGYLQQDSNQIIVPELVDLFDSIQLKGSVLIYNPESNLYYSNDFTWAKKGHLPASTFKIPNSIIALETGIIENDSSIIKWDGQKRARKVLERDMTFKEALKTSCLPCYREIARNIGLDRMKEYLNKLEFGSMIFDSIDLDYFWIQGNSRITQFEQIDFLKRLYFSELPISAQTTTIVKNMLVEHLSANYKLSGKTGWSITSDANNGWYVGYVEKEDGVYFFALNIEATQGFEMNKFAGIRIELSKSALEILNIL